MLGDMRVDERLTRWPNLDIPSKQARLRAAYRVSPAGLADAFAPATEEARRIADGLFRHDPSVWSADVAVQQSIANRLGWLASPELMADSLDRLLNAASTVKRDGFSDVVLLGMGGSSLAPEVLRAVLGVAPGWPRFRVLDSTDPAAIAASTTAPERTLYLLASKSGTTIEPNSLASYFRGRLEEAGVHRWADHFMAITDEGTALAHLARTEGFRDLFVNPSDIGGRYSALSYFGLVPAALMGQDVRAIVGWALAMLGEAETGHGTSSTVLSNPAVGLGLALGAAASAGRDKLTLLLHPALEPFGLWVEQLLAESTGKNGTGVIPIAGEELAAPSTYGSDRFFVRMRIRGSYAEEVRDAAVRKLEAAGAPVAETDLIEPAALGAEFMRWEIATAVAGGLLKINPFDEPNVQQAKDATRTLLQTFTSRGQLPCPQPERSLGDVSLTLTSAARAALNGQPPESVLTLLGPTDYFAELAYVGPDAALFDELRMLRMAVRDRTRVATTFGYGPRYLHSTGQLHKGGPNTGVFLLIAASPRTDLSIPGETFSFGTLELAQAFGDFGSLDATGRRALLAVLPVANPRLVQDLARVLLGRLPAS
jgi:transaldolase / glucose-6-phosphate isomerase